MPTPTVLLAPADSLPAGLAGQHAAASPPEGILVLLVEDNPADVRLIQEALRRVRQPDSAAASVRLAHVPRLADALERLLRGDVEAVLLDLSLPDSRGLETFRRLQERAPDVPVVVLSGLADEAVAAVAVREGAQDYLVKGQVNGQVLVRSLRYAIERRRAEAEREERLRQQLARAEAEAAQHRLALLAGASRAFAEAGLNFDAAAESVARSVAEVIGDGCAVFLRSPDGVSLTPAGLHHVEPDALSLARDLLAAAPAGSDSGIAGHVLRTGEPLLLAYVAVDELRPQVAPEHHPYLDRFPVHSVSAVPLRVEGRFDGVLCVWRDRSRDAYTGDDLRFLQDLADRAALALENARLYSQVQDALRTRDAFLASVAHDLKTPLTTVKGQSQLLARQLSRALTAGGPDEPVDPARVTALAETRLSFMNSAIDKMAGMLDELLDLTRLQMGQPLELHRTPTDLVALAHRVAAEHQQRTDRHHIAVVAGDGGLVGDWDEVRLERVLDNLVGNAVKYSPNGGDVTLELSRAAPRQGGPECAVLTVRDQGIGVPAADLPHVFERFRRAGNVVNHIRGTGIGLASARQIVEQHNGSISVSSQEGRGSTFTVSLPLGTAGAQAEAAA